MSVHILLNIPLKKKEKVGRERASPIIPTAIFRGKPTIKILIWGTVLAINPKATLENKRAAIKGAPTFIAIMKILFTIPNIDSMRIGEKLNSIGGTC